MKRDYKTTMELTKMHGYLIVGTGAALYAIPAVVYAAPAIGAEAALLAESGPVWGAYFSSTLTVKGILETSGYMAFANGTTNFTGQVINNDFKVDESINYAQVVFATSTRGLVSNLGESTFSLSLDKEGLNFGTNSTSEFYGTFFSNILGGEVSNKFNSTLQPLYNFDSTLKPFTDIFGGTVIEGGENIIGDEIIRQYEKNE